MQITNTKTVCTASASNLVCNYYFVLAYDIILFYFFSQTKLIMNHAVRHFSTLLISHLILFSFSISNSSIANRELHFWQTAIRVSNYSSNQQHEFQSAKVQQRKFGTIRNCNQTRNRATVCKNKKKPKLIRIRNLKKSKSFKEANLIFQKNVSHLVCAAAICEDSCYSAERQVFKTNISFSFTQTNPLKINVLVTKTYS